MKIIVINTKADSRAGILSSIAKQALAEGIISSTKAVVNAFQQREDEGTTGFEDGIAIPHARVPEIKKTAIIIARNKEGVNWPSLDGKKTTTAIAILVEGNSKAGNTHMEILSKIAACLMEEENREIFKSGTVKAIETVLKAKQENAIATNASHYDFVAVTSCPTGVAHTNMSAEALEKYARDNNLTIKVERQAAQGTVNPITQDDLGKTDHVILAIGRQIDGMERFDGKKVLQVGVAEPMKNSGKLWKDVQNASVYRDKSRGSKNNDGKKSTDSSAVGKVTIMQALMTGLSYMIPIVIVGGIFLAFGLGIGRMAVGGDVTDGTHNGTFWFGIFNIGVVGINLAVVILGGFIAQALGGRLALAPALILSAACQGVGMVKSGALFFNYETGGFGVDGSNLSFFGSVVAGIMFGYAAKYWTQYVSPKIPRTLKTIEPIIIVPIVFVLLGWMLFAFAFYLPLYYLSIGLNKGVVQLVDRNILWIAGAIGGAMLCFDLGGPVNKIAFGTGVMFLTRGDNYHPEVMGAFAAAGSVGPIGMAFGWLIGAKVFKIEKLRNDGMLRESFIPAVFMGLVGISEGAIPYTIKNPKTAIISNVIGGAIAGAMSGAFLISDSAAHTGPIVWVLGAIGHKDGMTDYLYGLLYLLSFLVGSIVTAFLFASLELFIDKRAKKGVTVNININPLKWFKKSSTTSKSKIEKQNLVWEGYAWKKLTQHRVRK